MSLTSIHCLPACQSRGTWPHSSYVPGLRQINGQLQSNFNGTLWTLFCIDSTVMIIININCLNIGISNLLSPSLRSDRVASILLGAAIQVPNDLTIWEKNFKKNLQSEWQWLPKECVGVGMCVRDENEVKQKRTTYLARQCQADATVQLRAFLCQGGCHCPGPHQLLRLRHELKPSLHKN